MNSLLSNKRNLAQTQCRRTDASLSQDRVFACVAGAASFSKLFKAIRTAMIGFDGLARFADPSTASKEVCANICCRYQRQAFRSQRRSSRTGSKRPGSHSRPHPSRTPLRLRRPFLPAKAAAIPARPAKQRVFAGNFQERENLPSKPRTRRPASRLTKDALSSSRGSGTDEQRRARARRDGASWDRPLNRQRSFVGGTLPGRKTRELHLSGGWAVPIIRSEWGGDTWPGGGQSTAVGEPAIPSHGEGTLDGGGGAADADTWTNGADGAAPPAVDKHAVSLGRERAPNGGGERLEKAEQAASRGGPQCPVASKGERWGRERYCDSEASHTASCERGPGSNVLGSAAAGAGFGREHEL